jgi:pyruvate dehydrogenase E1 component alpha subunit
MLFDAKTYRWYGQYDADDSLAYRPQAEIDSWKERCPIETYRARLEARGEITPMAFELLSRKVDTVVERAVQWALASPLAPIEEIGQHIYAASDVR